MNDRFADKLGGYINRKDSFRPVQINRFTLSFSGEDAHLEDRFLKDYVENSTQVFRIALVLGLFIYAMFSVLDYILFPEVKERLWFVRFAFVCPFGLASLVFSYFPSFKRYWQETISLNVIVAGLGVIAMIDIAPPPFNFSPYACLILVLFYSYTVPRALFLWSSLTGLILLLCYDIDALWIVETPVKILINNNFYFIGANLIGMITCYFMEYSARNNYWLMHRLEEEWQKVKTLSGFIPICTHCKKIRDDAGYWNHLESYLASHSDAQLSHCLCPDCLKELYPDMYEDIADSLSSGTSLWKGSGNED
jgi:hypothetical protein